MHVHWAHLKVEILVLVGPSLNKCINIFQTVQCIVLRVQARIVASPVKMDMEFRVEFVLLVLLGRILHHLCV